MRKPWASKIWREKRSRILNIRNKCEWCSSTDYLTIDHVTSPNSLSEDHYRELKNEDFLVLCRKCAYARKKGLVLCAKCKKHYHRLGFSTCRSCSPLFTEYKLPCENFVTILKEEVENECFSPMEACMHYCGNSEIGGDVNNCRDFKEYAMRDLASYGNP